MNNQWTRESIIDSYKKLANKINKTPTQSEYRYWYKNNKNELPSLDTIRKIFGNQNNLNIECELQLNYRCYTKEEIIDKLKEYYDKFGFPIKKDFVTYSKISNKAILAHFKTFKGLIESANIYIPKERLKKLEYQKCKMTDKELLQQVSNVINQHGIIPIKDFQLYGLYSFSLYKNRFSTYKNLLNLINYQIPQDKEQYFSEFRDISNDELIKYLQDYYNKNGLPTTRDFHCNRDYPSDYIYRSRFGSFKNALITANIEIPEDKLWLYDRESISDEDIIDKFKKYIYENFTEYDILPNWDKFKDIDILPSDSVLLRRFNSIQELYKSINVDYNQHNIEALKADMIQKYRSLYLKLKHTPDSRDIDKYSQYGDGYSMGAYEFHFGGVYKLQTYCNMLPTRIGLNKTRENLLEDLRDLADELGRLPIQKDVENCVWMASIGKYADEFGSFSNALKEADLHSTIYNKYKLTPKGNYCRSSYEYDFCVMLENKNISFKQEELYNKYIKDFDRRLRFDYTIYYNNQIFFIEIFGIMEREWYIAKTQFKINLCKINNLNLIPLYKEDFKNSSQDSLYKLLLNKINNQC